MGDLDGYFGELGQEMRAIADYLNIDLGIIVTLNFAYELRRVCSDAQNNVTICHHSGLPCTELESSCSNLHYAYPQIHTLKIDIRHFHIVGNFEG